MAQELQKRSEVKIEDTWDLTLLYKTKDEWEKDVKRVEELADKVASFKGRVSESGKVLLEILDVYSEGCQIVEKVFDYASRLSDQDQGDSENKIMASRAMSLYIESESKAAFITPEIIDIEDDALENFYKEEKGLELYRIYIDEIRRVKAHVRSAEVEELLASAGEMTNSPDDIYSSFTNVDMKFPEIVDENGETVRITEGRYIRFLESSDRRVRKDAFDKYYKVHEDYINSMASMYNAQVKALIFGAKARRYDNTLEAAVDANNVPSIVYHNLVDCVNDNLDKLHRFVGIRKKFMGLKELHMYDLYTPMVEGVARKYSFDEAKDLALKALAPLGEDYLAVVKEAFANRWIDKYENQGKRSGAYSAGAYGCPPYILLNYNGALDEVFTLVHEMGHSMHTYHSCKAQPFIYSQYKIFVAEVASTCNELLLLEYLLKNTTDKKERIYLLNHYMDMFRTTMFRQTQFAEFEMKTNKMVEDGEALTADNLSKLYHEINGKYYGDGIVNDDAIAYEWSRIPHFYYNFYVYQYATSFCASVYIAHEILKQGEPMVKKYKEFLSGGCSKSPVDLLKIVDVDFTTKKPIQSALDVMAEVLTELESLEN